MTWRCQKQSFADILQNMCWSLFLIKFNFIKKRLHVTIVKFLRTAFFIEHEVRIPYPPDHEDHRSFYIS